MTLRAAIYSRYSSDLQTDASIEAQVRACRELATRSDFKVVAEYEDKALSGSRFRTRPGIQALVAASKTSAFDVILTESLDRLSRDAEDLAGLWKRLKFAGLRIVTTTTGEVSDLHVGLSGIMGPLYVKELAHRTRRGMREKVLTGTSGGGKSYGYDIAPIVGSDGKVSRGHLTINENQAEIVRRIFSRYNDGQSPLSIAEALNAEAIPGPRGGLWRANTISGSKADQTGILRNPLYDGRRVWGKTVWQKDPDAETRVSRNTDATTWESVAVPELAIVPKPLFDAVQNQLTIRTRVGTSPGKPRPKRLLSGLVRCGACGGPMTTVTIDKAKRARLGCTAYYQTKTCTNKTLILEETIQERVLSVIREQALSPEAIEAGMKAYHAAMKQAASGAKADEAKARKDVADAQEARQRLTDAIAAGVDPLALVDALNATQARLEAAKLILSNLAENEKVMALHVEAPSYYRKVAERLHELMATPQAEELQRFLRPIIGVITAMPRDAHGNIELTVDGDLSTLLAGEKGGWSDLGAGTRIVRKPITFQAVIRPSIFASRKVA